MTSYYNEFDPFAAAWLRELIKAGEIPDGEVDTRSITDVRRDDLKGFTQCHFFAGIGGWSRALGLAGWPDDRPVWTGSCPCQSFSNAGEGKGREDARHLWPTWRNLIRECKPSIIFGEQVASAITFGWWDEVAYDLENEAYACAAAVLPACAIGAPHKRDRLFFMAHAESERKRREQCDIHEAHGGQVRQGLQQLDGSGESHVAHTIGNAGKSCGIMHTGEGKNGRHVSGGCIASAMANADSAERRPFTERRNVSDWSNARWEETTGRFTACGAYGGTRNIPDSDCAGQPNIQGIATEAWTHGRGFSNSENWWDIEPDVGRVVNGFPARVGLLRGFGNAIVPQVATEFIKAVSGS